MTTSIDHPAPPFKQVAAAVIGNALEWYDFIVYGFMAIVIARLFFPATSEYASMLLTTAAFGVGFFARPVGGILIGIYADRKGRKAALQLIISMMTIAIALIAFAPTHAAIGVAAPVLIVLARLLQGFATGGEFSSATSFLLEVAPPNKRGFYSSLQLFGQSLAVLAGAGMSALITRGLSPQEIESWGWRVPFLVGLLIGPVGLWIRRHMDETEAFKKVQDIAIEKRSLSYMLSNHLRDVVIVLGLSICGTVAFYIILIYMPTFANKELGLPLPDAFMAQAIALTFLTILIPIFGALSDRFGRKWIMIASSGLLFLALYPMFSWLHANPSFSNLVITQLVLCFCIGGFYGTYSAVVAEQFPAGVRSTGLAIGYNVAVMVFGGFAQFFVTWLVKETGTPIAFAFYVMFSAAVGLIAALFIVDRAHDSGLSIVDD